MPDNTPLPIEIETNDLLVAEYQYIAQTANQANEDRARVSSFYLIAVGSLIAALFGTQFFNSDARSPSISLMFGGLFLMLTLLGVSTIMQLARLRAAWYESMLAMNQIKDFIVSQNSQFSQVFRWTAGTLPPRYKIKSVSYYQAAEVAVIGGLMFGTGVFFLQHALIQGSINIVHWSLSIGGGILAVFLQLYIYKKTLE